MTNVSNYRYKIELIYVNGKTNKSTTIDNQHIISLIIDHNYSKNVMPILFINLSLDKMMIDDMILNVDNNFIIMALYKYDEFSDSMFEIEEFRDKFTYFINNDVNKNNNIDYNEDTENVHMSSTFKQISLGLLSINHINNNKKSIDMNVKNASMYHIVKHCTSHFNNIVIEQFNYNNTFDQLIIPPKDSIKKTLEFLNNYRVFYRTPFRYYQDFDCAYIISSSGIAIPKKEDIYTSVIFNIKEFTEIESNDPGIFLYRDTKNYMVNVSYLNTTVYNNSISNKSKNKIRLISSNGNDVRSLKNNALYSTDKYRNIRLNNDNINMADNIESDFNSSNVFVNLSKEGLDASVITINKKYSINHIDRYLDYNGDYLLSRKIEMYEKEGESFKMNMILNLQKID